VSELSDKLWAGSDNRFDTTPQLDDTYLCGIIKVCSSDAEWLSTSCEAVALVRIIERV